MRYGVRDAVQDVCGFGGIAAVAWGLWQVWPPAMWLWLGAVLLTLSGWVRTRGG